MRSNKVGGLAVLAWLTVLGTAVPAEALVPRLDPPVPQRMALADWVLVGRVTALEDHRVTALPPLKVPGAKKVEYQVAVVKISEALVGAKGLRDVRVAVIAPQAVGAGAGPRFRRWPQVKLAADQEACFFLTKHPEESFYVALAPYDVIDKESNAFDKDVALARRCIQLMGDPNGGLQSKAAEERLLTAALLVFRYRTPRDVYTGVPKTEPIAAEQSKRILETLADADWSKSEGPAGPHGLFMRLGVTAEDGWTQPADFKKVPAAAKKWLRDNAATYCIRRYVPEETTSPKE